MIAGTIVVAAGLGLLTGTLWREYRDLPWTSFCGESTDFNSQMGD
jgi:hypothetical protein